MRTLLLLATLAVAISVGAFFVARAEAPSISMTRDGAVTLVGDSLNVGIEPYLPGLLEGWSIRNRNEVGRSTTAGIDVLRAEGSALAPNVVVSLGTNDRSGNVAAFRESVRAALQIAGGRRCVVWVNVVVAGEAFDPLNGVLEEEAARVANLRVVNWAGMLAEHPEWLAGDGIHGTDMGYAKRAEAVAGAVRACERGRSER